MLLSDVLAVCGTRRGAEDRRAEFARLLKSSGFVENYCVGIRYAKGVYLVVLVARRRSSQCAT